MQEEHLTLLSSWKEEIHIFHMEGAHPASEGRTPLSLEFRVKSLYKQSLLL